MRFSRLVVPILFAGACHQGPLGSAPFVERLSEESQAEVDQSWSNLITPADRHDRLTLLDVMVINGLYYRGVDSLEMVSQKAVNGGLVVMRVRFDRAEPSFDEFTISYIDSSGRELRRERYTSEEVKRRADYFQHEYANAVATGGAAGSDLSSMTAEQQAGLKDCLERAEAFRQHLLRLEAATQPADAASIEDQEEVPEGDPHL